MYFLFYLQMVYYFINVFGEPHDELSWTELTCKSFQIFCKTKKMARKENNILQVLVIWMYE